MTHTIQPDEHYSAGEYIRWEYTVTNDDGGAKDVTGADVSWYLLPERGADTADALYDDSDPAITAGVVTGEETNGRVNVEIASDTTTDLGGRVLWQRLVVVDNSGHKQVWAGKFPIDEN